MGTAAAGETESRLDEPRPGKPAVSAPERVEPSRDARDAAGADPDGVVDDLGAEWNLELE